jgi:ubiquinone/menaquinone biosynthesis C-methylase UbiE
MPGENCVSSTIDPEAAVRERYSAAAEAREEALCCPVSYDPRYLAAIPDEVLERDYGCGDPSAFVREGETVVDLGSGSGKVCFIAALIVGPTGRVFGVVANAEMLALAEGARSIVAERIGYANVEFRKGRIQDLRLDHALVDAWLAERPISSSGDLAAFEAFCAEARAERPLVADESVDLVLSNCVLNLVRPDEKEALFAEIFRVVRRGGRVAISDIVSDEEVPEHLRRDPELWSGCVSGAYREDAFLDAFDRAGFYGMQIVKRDERPWRTVEGIEFRSMTVVAHKGKQGPCLERNQAVIYSGPWRKVIDDDGHVLERGKRTAVCDKTFGIYSREPYAHDILPVEPFVEVPLEEAGQFDCRRTAVRDPRETKGRGYDVTSTGGECCEPGECC